jgi:hypothetical protein
MTIHAWFSSVIALRDGSWRYRKPDGATVNVTRVDAKAPADRWGRPDEIYVGQVVRAEDGGCITPRMRVPGVTD